MEKTIKYVGLNVHKDTIQVAIAEKGRTKISAIRLRQPPDERKSCGTQPANFSVISCRINDPAFEMIDEHTPNKSMGQGLIFFVDKCQPYQLVSHIG